MQKHLIRLYVSNKPGVLIRIALVFSRRGFNIDSLVVSPDANNPEFSWMNIGASGQGNVLEHILKQLNELIDVVRAEDHTVIGSNAIRRNMGLIKLKFEKDSRTAILQMLKALKAKIITLDNRSIIFQITGTPEKLEEIKVIFNGYGIMEYVRTGTILIS